MPKKKPEMANVTDVAGPRLPNFGAEMAIGPPSRAYRSPLFLSATGTGAVAPSYLDQEADIDAGADEASDVDSDDSNDSDDSQGEANTDEASDLGSDDGNDSDDSQGES